MSSEALLDEAQLGRAAFDLLSSSTLGRYLRKAREHADQAGLSALARTDAAALARFITRAEHLWENVSVQATRELDEIELAVALAAVETSSHEAVVALFERIAAHADAPSRWIPALARQWRGRHRPRREIRDVAWRGGPRGSHRELLEAPCI